MEQAIKLRSISPEIGPQGLVLEMPDRVHPVTTADIFEVLRWVHGDLKQIHAAFAHLDKMRKEVATIKQIHKKQEYAYEAQAETLKLQDSRHALLLAKIEQQDQTISTLAQAITTMAHSVAESTEKFKSIEERVNLPWWKKLFR